MTDDTENLPHGHRPNRPDKHDEIAKLIVADMSSDIRAYALKPMLQERVAVILRSQAAEYEAKLKEKDAEIESLRAELDQEN